MVQCLRIYFAFTERRSTSALQKLKNYLRNDVVLSVSLLLALLSCLIEPPSLKYLRYIDFNTLIMLFCLMLIIEGLREQNFLQFIGSRILIKVKTRRGIVFTLIFLCFISSMFITNDVSLITFVPFGIMILEMINLTDKLCGTVTLMTIAANLGSYVYAYRQSAEFVPVFAFRHGRAGIFGTDVAVYRPCRFYADGSCACILPEEHLQLDIKTERLKRQAHRLLLPCFICLVRAYRGPLCAAPGTAGNRCRRTFIQK